MTHPTLTHSYSCRDAELDGRTLTVACVPFDDPSPVSDDGHTIYVEQFDRGAFERVVRTPHRTSLYLEHDPDTQLTIARQLREDPKYLIGVFPVAPSDDGDEALEQIRSNRFAGVSLGFVAGDHDGDNPIINGVTHRRRVKALREVSLVKEPAYTDAKVLSIRSRSAAAVERERLRWLFELR